VFSPRSQQKRLNAAFKELEKVQDELHALGDRPAEYLALEEERRKLNARGTELGVRLEALDREVKELERLEACAADVVALAVLEESLSGTEGFETFPADGLRRLEELAERLSTARASRESLEQECGSLATARAGIERVDEAAVRQLSAALDRVDRRSRLDEALPGRRAAFEARRNELSAAFAGLGLSLPLEALGSLDLGGAARARLVELRDQLAEARRSLHTVSLQVEATEATVTRLTVEAERLEREQAGLSTETAGAVRRRQAALARIVPLRAEVDRSRATVAELNARAESLAATS
jgi:chromosome segregation ATPase